MQPSGNTPFIADYYLKSPSCTQWKYLLEFVNVPSPRCFDFHIDTIITQQIAVNAAATVTIYMSFSLCEIHIYVVRANKIHFSKPEQYMPLKVKIYTPVVHGVKTRFGIPVLITCALHLKLQEKRHESKRV